jgi:hypothetical protein
MTAQDLGVVVDFSQHGNSRLFCAAGWSGFEPDERWAIGSESRLNLPSPTAPGSYFLVLKLRPFEAPGRLNGQHLSIVVNGSVVGEFWVTDRTSRVCYLPWQLLDGQRELEITFRTPDAASPSALAVGDDDRVLAVAFSSLALYRDRYVMPDPGPAGVLETNRSSSGDPACMPARDLLMRFESLGQSCEFGLVQRRCQIEPLGFLRFASSPLSHLQLKLINRRRMNGAIKRSPSSLRHLWISQHPDGFVVQVRASLVSAIKSRLFLYPSCFPRPTAIRVGRKADVRTCARPPPVFPGDR